MSKLPIKYKVFVDKRQHCSLKSIQAAKPAKEKTIAMDFFDASVKSLLRQLC
jgi:hypothetical protein